MAFLDTKHKKKSAVLTLLILLLLLFGIFNYGMKYLDPPIEYGLAINFGNSEVGRGDPVEHTQQQSSTKEVTEEQVQPQEEVQDTPQETAQEDIITDESAEDVPVVEKNDQTKEETVEKTVETPKKETPKPKEKEKPKPSKAASDALNSLLNGTSDKGAAGEGDDAQEGTKGNKNGDANSSKYYGKAGSGSGGNYNLAGRKALSKPIEKPDCQQEGIVVVSIEVDKNGKVIKAIPGVKGSTNTSPCLLKPAKEAALRTKWNPDGNAPSRQKGTIIYKFSLAQ